MFVLFLLILGAACFLCITSPRNAILAILAIGFLQDPFRKIIPGEPIFLIVTVGLVFGVVFLSTVQRQGVGGLSTPFIGWSSLTKQPLTAFFIVLALQFVHSMVRYGNPLISLIGLLSYTAPFFAIVVGYYLVTRSNDIRAFMKVYVLVGILLSITVILSFSGFELKIFKEVGKGLLIYDQGTILRSFSGFMRTGEIAAWHMATACCFIIVLFFSSKNRAPALLVVFLVLLLMAAIAFTGRRKMLMLVTIFGMLYGVGFAYYRRQFSVSYLITAVTLVFCVWLVVELIAPGGYGDGVGNYIARGTSVYSSASGRALELGLRPINWAFNRVGVLGGGLGIASQGSHFFNVTSIAGGSGEGGLGKIMVELGVPGLLVSVWLMYALARYISVAIKLSAQNFVPMSLMPLMLGIAGILLVNVLTFAVATQVYGDMFILILIGLLAGFLFALPKLVVQEIKDNGPQHKADALSTGSFHNR